MAAAPKAEPVTEPPAPVPTPVPATSVATRGPVAGEVTVRFRRWTAHGVTAYQAGQFAGFLRPVAERLVADGVAVLVEAPGHMVTK